VAEYADVPAPALAELRSICGGLPEAYEEPAWTGTRWRIRKRTFAHVLTRDGPNGPVTLLVFRASGPEFDVLKHAGHPFFWPGWNNALCMVFDDATDWDEVQELVTESYCMLAPKKLVAQVDRPEE
jgi:hypothetical protein